MRQNLINSIVNSLNADVISSISRFEDPAKLIEKMLHFLSCYNMINENETNYLIDISLNHAAPLSAQQNIIIKKNAYSYFVASVCRKMQSDFNLIRPIGNGNSKLISYIG